MSGARTALPARLRVGRLPRPRGRVVVIVALAAALLTAGWLWFRDSGFARVETVFITGTSPGQDAAIRSALRKSAREMTTLHVRESALRSAVAAYPSVADLRIDAEFPHKLSIEVVEHRPVAIVELPGRRVPASGGGVLLRGIREPGDLPVIRTRRPLGGERVTERATLGALAVAGSAPAALHDRVTSVGWERRGLVAELRDGPPLIFGTPDQPRAKWDAAARVLADPAAAGATYLDLRVPERVGAGGLGPVTEEPAEGAAGATDPEAAEAPAEPGATAPEAAEAPAEPGATAPEEAAPEVAEPTVPDPQP